MVVPVRVEGCGYLECDVALTRDASGARVSWPIWRLPVLDSCMLHSSAVSIACSGARWNARLFVRGHGGAVVAMLGQL